MMPFHRASSSKRPSASRRRTARSEEHTSELQSLMRTSYAGFRLKKKKKSRTSHHSLIHTTVKPTHSADKKSLSQLIKRNTYTKQPIHMHYVYLYEKKVTIMS